MKTRLTVAVAAGAMIFGLAMPVSAVADEAGSTRAEGVLPDGRATWIADVPREWDGTLVLYGHGYNGAPSNPATNAPDPTTAQALLDRGYAIAGSSYERSGWTLDTAAQDQLETVAAFTARFGEPERVIALGNSMGGLITGQLAETPGDVIDGAVPMCGLMSGGVQLLNYQLDGLHALAQLVVPEGETLELVGYSDAGEAQALVATLEAAVTVAEQSAAGRARLALAAALFHSSTWADGQPEPSRRDLDAQASAQIAVMKSNLAFFSFGRFDIEQTHGGNASWNAGVDYQALITHSATRDVVKKLYREAGLDLRADLDTLTATADVTADPAALERARAVSDLTGRLQVPVLSVHTTNDTLMPAQVQEEYDEMVRDARAGGLLRQALVHRVGHCTFSPGEYVAAVLAMDERLDRGRWTFASTPWGLDRAAESIDLGGSEYDIRYRAEEWLGDRGGHLGGPRY